MQVHQTPTLLLTRPRAASERFAKGLQGANVVIAPLMEIAPTGASVDLRGVAGVILTSEAAVAFVPETDVPAYCVGPRTAEAARAAGLTAKVMGKDADTLVQAMAARAPNGSLLHLHGTHTRGDVAARLSAHGVAVSGIAVYDQRAVPPGAAFYEALTRPYLIVPLFSPRSARLFAEAAPTLREDTMLVALSRAVASALPPMMQDRARIAAAPTGKDMQNALEPLGVQRNSP